MGRVFEFGDRRGVGLWGVYFVFRFIEDGRFGGIFRIFLGCEFVRARVESITFGLVFVSVVRGVGGFL